MFRKKLCVVKEKAPDVECNCVYEIEPMVWSRVGPDPQLQPVTGPGAATVSARDFLYPFPTGWIF